ncbi:MAG: HAMP domain-containing sensor histidine kinase [bacterium]|nr:HAMP domain-containing sensor histidine kinase [bacterium]
MIYLNYQNYENKFEILATIIENTSEDNIDAVLGILQERDVVSAEHGYQILEKYGYTDSNNNALFRMFQSQTLLIVASTGVIFTVLMLALLKWKNAVWKETVDVLSQIELTLMHFRENKMSVLELADDIPEYEKITHQLKALGRQLDLLREETVKEKEGTKQLVADISHQLKTPVAALNTSFSILLQNDLNKEEREEFSKRCQSALDGLEVLLQSLLQISRLEAGLIQIELSSKPFIDTILVAVNRVYPKASVKNIEISFEYEPALDKIVIKQDHKWLAEALVNVLDNAIKYSPNDTEIAIRVKKRTTILRVEIEDHGVGIPKEEYHKIFQRFFRGTTQQVKEETGSGIGLYLARKIIEDHNGTISVSSNWKKRVGTENENPGSTFLIQLPVLDMLE